MYAQTGQICEKRKARSTGTSNGQKRKRKHSVGIPGSGAICDAESNSGRAVTAPRVEVFEAGEELFYTNERKLLPIL
jgi:hypothetical protein